MLTLNICKECNQELQRFCSFKKKVLNNQQKLMNLLKTVNTAMTKNTVVDPIKVEFIEPTAFIKEELQDESVDQVEDLNKTLSKHRKKLARFSVPKSLYPRAKESFPCYQCDEVFFIESEVRQHAEIVHTPLDIELETSVSFMFKYLHVRF